MGSNGVEDTEKPTPKPAAALGGEHLDVEAYAGLYTGRTKITRLLFIADRCGNESLQLEALRMAYDEIRKSENTCLHREVAQKIAGRLGSDFLLDQAWADAVDRRAELKKEKLENELNGYRVYLDFLLYLFLCNIEQDHIFFLLIPVIS